jgi:predicted transcriptional regulator
MGWHDDRLGHLPTEAGTGRPAAHALSPQASTLAAVFKALASDTRLRLLHVLARTGEVRVSELAAATAMKPQAVSNQLQRWASVASLRPAGTAPTSTTASRTGA